MRRRRTETFSLSSSLTFTVSFFWKKKNRLRENRDELWTHECQCETSWRLSHALPNYTRPTAKKKTTTQKLRWTFGAAIFNKNGGFFSKRWPCWTWRNIIWYKWMMTAPFVGPKAVSRRLTISLDDDDYRELPFFSRTQLALASFSRKLLHYMTASYLLYTTKTYVRQGKKIQCARERENHTQVYLRYLRGRPYGGRWPPSTRGDIRQMVFMTSRS